MTPTAYVIDGGLYEVECPACGFYVRRRTEHGALARFVLHTCPVEEVVA